MTISDYDVIIIGAGAAGLMCTIEAGKRGRKTLIIDHSKKVGEKIRISGGGRCNFTNIYTSPDNYLSENPHFCKSALSRFTQYDFIDMVERHNIPYHEKTLGQLFCDNSAQNIIDMLTNECDNNNVKIESNITILSIEKIEDFYILKTNHNIYKCQSLVMACGGLSIPKIGATGFGYDIAKQFGHDIIPTRAGLVPLTFQNEILEMCKDLSGLSVDARVYASDKTSFAEGLLFTHRGLSGPSILQISSYWKNGETIEVNLLPNVNIEDALHPLKTTNPKQNIQTIIAQYLPKRLAIKICEKLNINKNISEISNLEIQQLHSHINAWKIQPNGSEGYRTAEVTLGGVNTKELSSKTMESTLSKGLYFIGEVVDVTGHLGGFNFQWAWSSGWACGQHC